MNKFFEENKVPNGETSYLTSLLNNQYSYSNITNLVNYLRRQRRDNPNEYDKDADWNKILLIPVEQVQTSSDNPTTIRVLHDLGLNFTKLKKEDIKLQVIYTKYKDEQ